MPEAVYDALQAQQLLWADATRDARDAREEQKTAAFRWAEERARVEFRAARAAVKVDPERLWQLVRAERERAAAQAASWRTQLPLPTELGQWNLNRELETVAPLPLPEAGELPEGPWEVRRELFERQEQLALELDKRGLTKRAGRHRECNRTWNTWRCDSCDGRSQAAIATCKLRTCVMCQRRQAKELAGDVHERIRQVKSQKGWRLRMITLTIATHGAGDLGRAVRLLGESLPKLWRQLLKRKGAGALFAMEAGELQGNIHAHGLYFGPWVDQAELSTAWQKLTGACVVDVRLARGEQAVAEVCKYVCDPDLPRHILAELEEALIGHRRLRTYGVFYGAGEEAEDLHPGKTCPHCGTVGLRLEGTCYLTAGLPQGTGPPLGTLTN